MFVCNSGCTYETYDTLWSVFRRLGTSFESTRFQTADLKLLHIVWIPFDVSITVVER